MGVFGWAGCSNRWGSVVEVFSLAGCSAELGPLLGLFWWAGQFTELGIHEDSFPSMQLHVP